MHLIGISFSNPKIHSISDNPFGLALRLSVVITSITYQPPLLENPIIFSEDEGAEIYNIAVVALTTEPRLCSYIFGTTTATKKGRNNDILHLHHDNKYFNATVCLSVQQVSERFMSRNTLGKLYIVKSTSIVHHP